MLTNFARCSRNLLTNAFEALDGRGSVSITATVGLMDARRLRRRHARRFPTVVIEIVRQRAGVLSGIDR